MLIYIVKIYIEHIILNIHKKSCTISKTAEKNQCKADISGKGGAPMQIYRKRLIPDECILLKDDEILEIDEDYIVTKWKTLKPRRDFSHGYSCYFLKLGFKISKFFSS